MEDTAVSQALTEAWELTGEKGEQEQVCIPKNMPVCGHKLEVRALSEVGNGNCPSTYPFTIATKSPMLPLLLQLGKVLFKLWPQYEISHMAWSNLGASR